MTKHEAISVPQNDHPVGIFADIPNEVYHGGPGVSKSGLDLIRKSPMHYKASRDVKKESTAAQREGTLIHDLVLEPATFWDRYARPFVAPEGAVSTVEEIKNLLKDRGLPTSGKKADLQARLAEADPYVVFLDELKAEYLEEVGDKTVITEEEYVKAQAIAASVLSHPIAGKLFAAGAGDAELSCYWIDEKTGVLCRVRPDFWRHDRLVVDLKTTVDASPEGFSRSIEKWSYHVQDPFYQDGISAAIQQSGSDRKPPKAFIFVAVEKTAPYAVGVYRLDADSAEIGRREYRENLDTYARSLATDNWPGYSTKIEAIGLPEWRINRELGEE